MFSLMQETENGQKLWPGISHVYTTPSGPNGSRTVTALFDKGGLMDFPASRNTHNIYVMNEAGATVARYFIGNNPMAPEAGTPLADDIAQELLSGGRVTAEAAQAS
jgi:hypothetical protein